ncbi:MAG: SBBP repeat-containing protein [Sphingobacteriaceae bacterium]|nr:SBBP repeat-containing protein [Sphingobacteriaceae bacterium]
MRLLCVSTVDFNPGVGTNSLTSIGTNDIFISKLDAAGNFVWAKTMGSTTGDVATCITFDASANVYTSGYYSGTADFDPGAGTSNLTVTGVNDIFVSKLDAAGNFVWAKKMGGSATDITQNIFVDPTGNVYTTGYFSGTPDLILSLILYLTSTGLEDIFVSKLDALGNFVWAKNLGGSGYDVGYGITVDAVGNVYTSGNFNASGDFDPNAGVSTL